MTVFLKIAELKFAFFSERIFDIDEGLSKFVVKDDGSEADVEVTVSWNWEELRVPQSPMLGEDMLLEYYSDDGQMYCMTKGGPKGYTLGCVASRDMRKITCYVNEKPFICSPTNLGSFLRSIPVRAIFLQNDIVFFHASQIALHNKGILFTAPSGTGKTTQAKLWRDNRGAEIICNDRTICRRIDGVWRTFGFPADGAEPVLSTKSFLLGCIVLLEQAADNEVIRISSAKAASKLMQQIVFDTWSAEQRALVIEALFRLMEEVPVFLLRCTPDSEAVACMENYLLEKGVI